MVVRHGQSGLRPSQEASRPVLFAFTIQLDPPDVPSGRELQRPYGNCGAKRLFSSGRDTGWASNLELSVDLDWLVSKRPLKDDRLTIRINEANRELVLAVRFGPWDANNDYKRRG